jgi:uncharacterized protein
MTMIRDFGSLVDLEEKAVSDTGDVWTITGYGSIFNNVDQGNDVVVPGAFAKSLRTHGMPLLLFNHKMEDAPIGTIVDAKEDKRGLWFKAELPKDDSFVSGRIVPQLKRRGLKGTSIGYRVAPGGKEVRKADGARLLKELRLFEISVVNMPMNTEAGVETVKGLVPFQDLSIDSKSKEWDAGAALTRLRAHFSDDEEGLKTAFLYADPDKSSSEWDARFLIADVDENGCVKANHVAIHKAAAVLYGSRVGDVLPEGADEAVKSIIDRYYQRLDLESPAKSLSVNEWSSLSVGEREARLRGLGISQRLAKQLLIGQRDADRKSPPRDAAAHEDALKVLSAFSSILEHAAAIKR